MSPPVIAGHSPTKHAEKPQDEMQDGGEGPEKPATKPVLHCPVPLNSQGTRLGGRRNHEIAHQKGQGTPTLEGDGKPRQLVLAQRREMAHQMVLDGMGTRAIARALGVDPATVDSDLKVILAEDAARKALRDPDALRDVITARLDGGRERLLAIVRSQSATASEKIAAERAMAAIEEQRAKLLGVQARGAAGELVDLLNDITRKRDPDTAAADPHSMDVAGPNPLHMLPMESPRGAQVVDPATPWNQVQTRTSGT